VKVKVIAPLALVLIRTAQRLRVSALWMAISALGICQSTDPAFDVASIKLMDPKPPFQLTLGPRIGPGPRVTFGRVTAFGLIAMGYGLHGYQIVGAPSWCSEDYYDLRAIAPGDATPTPEQFRGMLRSLLRERFALRSRNDSKEFSVYRLQTTTALRLVESGVVEKAPLMRRGSLEAKGMTTGDLATYVGNVRDSV
jgi:uncharacterized protein (TIGR03435 family)